MKKVRLNLIRKEALIALVVAGIFMLIAFTNRYNESNIVRSVHVIIENDENNHVLEESDIFHLMQLERENLLGASAGNLNLQKLEQRLSTNKWVEDANVYFDLKGNLFIEVSLRKALARLLNPNGSGAFIATDGTLMPVPHRFTLRRLTITGSKVHELARAGNLYQHPYGTTLMPLLHILNQDAFWQAQIAQLDIAANGKIAMIPQVGGQIIEFGYPDEAKEKLKKLDVFFTRILPTLGWSRYHRVNVEYRNQIVAE